MLERENLITLVIPRQGVYSVGVNLYESRGSAASEGWLLCMKYGSFRQLFVSTILKPLALWLSSFFLIIITVWFTMLLPQQHCNLLSPCLILVSVLLCAPRRRLRARKGPEYTWAADDVAAAFTNHVWEVKERSSSHCSQAWPAGCSCQELVPVSTIIFMGHGESPEKQRVQD